MHEATRVEADQDAAAHRQIEALAVDRFPGHAGAVEVGLECADHALRPAEKHRQGSGVVTRGREDLVGVRRPSTVEFTRCRRSSWWRSAIPSSSEAKGAPPSVEV